MSSAETPKGKKRSSPAPDTPEKSLSATRVCPDAPTKPNRNGLRKRHRISAPSASAPIPTPTNTSDAPDAPEVQPVARRLDFQDPPRTPLHSSLPEDAPLTSVTERIRLALNFLEYSLNSNISRITETLNVTTLKHYYNCSPEIQFTAVLNGLIKRSSNSADREALLTLQRHFEKSVPPQQLEQASAMRNLMRLSVLIKKLSANPSDPNIFLDWYGPDCDPKLPICNLYLPDPSESSSETPEKPTLSDGAWTSKYHDSGVWKELQRLSRSQSESDSDSDSDQDCLSFKTNSDSDTDNY